MVLVASLGAPAITQQTPVVRTPLLAHQLATSKEVGAVRAVRIDYQPGQTSGAHQHPVPAVGVVLSGQVRFQVEGEPARLISAGEAFVEPPNTTVVHFDNASLSEPASFVAFYLLAPGETEVVRPVR